MLPKPPIIHVEGNDIAVFDSTNEAEGWYESWAVGREDYSVFDSEGRRLILSIAAEQPVRARFLGLSFGAPRLQLRVPEGGAPQPEFVEAALRRYIEALALRTGVEGARSVSKAASLSELAALAKVAADAEQRRYWFGFRLS